MNQMRAKESGFIRKIELFRKSFAYFHKKLIIITLLLPPNLEGKSAIINLYDGSNHFVLQPGSFSSLKNKAKVKSEFYAQIYGQIAKVPTSHAACSV